jgi:hypothetical protein
LGNLVTYKARPDLESIRMSNGLTSVFISVLSLASSALAESDRQRAFAAWFAAHDQGVFGLGIVGFDISRFPWSPDSIADDRQFLLHVIEAARAKTGWDLLGYQPREEWVLSCLDKLKAMVQAFVIEHACGSESMVWPFGGRPSRFVRCPAHRVYQHEHGCPLCNDS